MILFLRRHLDVVVAVVLAVVASGELAAWVEDGLPLAMAAGLLMTLPLAVRRSAPLVSFLLVSGGIEALVRLQQGFDNDSASMVTAYVLSVYSLGRWATGTQAWLGALGVLVRMLQFVASDGGLAEADVGDYAFVLAFVAAPWVAGLTIRVRNEREGVLHARNEALRAEQEEVARRAVVEERSRIARELHDVVSHAISVTVLQARGARRQLGTDPDEVRRALDAIEQTNTAALGDMRRLLAVLRDTEGDAADHHPQPSLAHLDGLVDHVRGAGVPVCVDVVGDPSGIPPGVDLSAYRIVQEALTNVIKHAGDATARVSLEYLPDALHVRVLDSGRGASNGADPHGHGLIGIRERVAVVGGEVWTGPGTDGGFEVRARLPYALEAV